MEHTFPETWQELPAEEFAALGLEEMAYVKPKKVGTRDLFAIHTANGDEVAVVDGRDLAFATIIQNDLEPVSIH